MGHKLTFMATKMSMKVLNLANQQPDSDLHSNEDEFLQRAAILTAVPPPL